MAEEIKDLNTENLEEKEKLNDEKKNEKEDEVNKKSKGTDSTVAKAKLEFERKLKEKELEFEEKMSKFNSMIQEKENEWNDKYNNLKETYVSEESKKKLEEEERKAKDKKERELKEKADREEKERIEKLKLELEIQAQNFTRIEVADELQIEKHLRKYITGKTKEEMLESAKSLVDDMVKTQEDFEKAVQEEVERRFSNGSGSFKKSTNVNSNKLTLEQFQKMSTTEKLELYDTNRAEFDRLLSEKKKNIGL